jgi:hypothetical protein
VEGPGYPVTWIWKESDIKSSKAKRRILSSGELVHLTLLGCCEKEGKRPDLVYAVTCRKPRSKIFNASQTAAFILNQSRKIFFSRVLTLLRLMDPGMAEPCYFDTDRSGGPCVKRELAILTEAFSQHHHGLH